MKLRVKMEINIMRKNGEYFFKIQSGNKNMPQKIIISLKYWKIWMMKIVLTIILMINGKTLKQ